MLFYWLSENCCYGTKCFSPSDAMILGNQSAAKLMSPCQDDDFSKAYTTDLFEAQPYC